MYQTIRCPNSTTLWILTTVSASNPVPKIKNSNVEGNITMGKLNYRTAVYIFTQYLISHTFSTHCEHCYILCLKKLRTQTVFNIHTHFTIRTTCVEFQTSTTIIPQGNLTADCEIKQHIWQWKAKEDCSSNAVPCVILVIWMTVTTT